jgi:hypothetical protein
MHDGLPDRVEAEDTRGPEEARTPGTTLKPALILTSARSFPIPWFQLLETDPIAASVAITVSVGSTRVATCAITVLPPATQ